MNPRSSALFTSLALLTSTPLWGAMVFEDHFHADPHGANRTLYQNAVVTSQVTQTPTWNATDNSYLNTSALGQSNNARLATYSPKSLASSWEALAGSSTLGGTNFTTLNGGFSFFTRVNASDTHQSRADIHWLRPVDIAGTVVSGVNSQAFRMIFEGQSNGNMLFQLFTNGEKAFSRTIAQPTLFDASSINLVVPNFYQQLAPETQWHLGFTFDTNPNTGLITLKILGREGTDGIDTTVADHVLASTQFYISDDIARNTASGTPRTIFGGLRNWDMAARSASRTFATNSIDYDGIRMYAGTVTEFASLAVPEPTFANLTMLAMGALLLQRRVTSTRH